MFGVLWLDQHHGGGSVLAAVLGLLAAKSLAELYALVDVRAGGLRVLGIAAALGLLIAQWADHAHPTLFGAVQLVDLTHVGLLVAMAGGTLLLGDPPPAPGDKRPASHSATQLGLATAGLLYVALPLSFVLAVRLRLPAEIGLTGVEATRAGIALTVYLILVAKGADMGGYMIGKAFGRHKLAPSISPKKSWEGTIAGFAVSIALATLLIEPLVAPALAPAGRPVPSLWIAALFGLVMGPLSLAGDLFESYVKRWAAAKDSDDLIPAFGGILDLLDSLTFCAPVGYIALLAWLGAPPPA